MVRFIYYIAYYFNMLDKKTFRILYELSKNARLPVKKLAKKIGLSEPATSYRLKQLYEDDVIISTAPIIDHSKLGHMVFRLYANFFGTTPNEEEEIFKWLKSQEEVSVLARTRGDYEILIMSVVNSYQKFHEFIKKFKVKYRSKIGVLETFTYLKTYHFSREYLYEDKTKARDFIVTGVSKPENLDEIDHKILKSLAFDARKPVLKIAEEIRIPVRTVANRLKLLENKKIIMGYALNINLIKIGREYFKLNIIGSENINYSSLVSFALQLDCSIYVDETIGKFDFELNVEVKDKEELNQVIRELKEKMKGVRELGIFQIERYVKLTYLG